MTRPLRRSSVVELLGPAGGGKTTLLMALARHDPQVHPIRTLRGLLTLRSATRAAISLMPIAAVLFVTAPIFLARNLRLLARLMLFRHIVEGQLAHREGVVVLDEGPLFLLTRLGTDYKKQPAAILHRLWQSSIRYWTTRLAGVIWLDAPNSTLVERIRTRTKAHRIKDATEHDTNGFLARYRATYEEVLRCVRGRPGGNLFAYQTGSLCVEELVQVLLPRLEQLRSGNDGGSRLAAVHRDAIDPS